MRERAGKSLREEIMALMLEATAMRKVALRFLPLLGLCYTINVLDRFNVSIAALTMNKALGLSATTYGLGAGAFFGAMCCSKCRLTRCCRGSEHGAGSR
jgi:hypothetical protein